MNPARRRVSAVLALVPFFAWRGAQATAPRIEVWRSPTCGCCKDWIAYVERNGFVVKSHETGNAETHAKAGLPSRYGSCHTALIEGYLVEGHVPVREIRRLL